MKLLLDMYKGVSKETRDKTQLMAAERKARQEIDELKQQLKKMREANESKREERKRLADDEALKKIRSLEEAVHALQKQVIRLRYLVPFLPFSTQEWIPGGGSEARGRGLTQRDGSDGPGLRRHAGTKFSFDPAVEREGWRQLQTDVGANQGSTSTQASAGGERHACRSSERQSILSL